MFKCAKLAEILFFSKPVKVNTPITSHMSCSIDTKSSDCCCLNVDGVIDAIVDLYLKNRIFDCILNSSVQSIKTKHQFVT